MMKWVGALSLLESARTDSKRRMPTMGCNLSKQRPVRPQRPTSDVSSSSKSHDGKKHSSKYKEVSEICVTYLLLAAERELNHFALLQQNKGFHTDYRYSKQPCLFTLEWDFMLLAWLLIFRHRSIKSIPWEMMASHLLNWNSLPCSMNHYVAISRQQWKRNEISFFGYYLFGGEVGA